MPVTRRSLLGTIGSLAAVQGLAGTLLPAAAQAQSDAPVTRTPRVKSIFILFEGPWLFDSNGSATTVRATTLGEKAPSGTTELHQCEVGKGKARNPHILHPLNTTGGGVLLPAGGRWTVTGTSYVPSASFLSAFSLPFAEDSFLWMRNGAKVTPMTADRVVTVPLPSAVFMGGRMVSAVVSETNMLVKPHSSARAPQPYVTTIFEYVPVPGASVGMTLKAGADTFTLVPGDHLVLRLQRTDGMPMPDTTADAAHSRMAFDNIMKRVKGRDPVPTLVALPDTTTEEGTNTAGFEKYEMGIGGENTQAQLTNPRAQYASLGGAMYSNTMYNCDGAGGPVGP